MSGGFTKGPWEAWHDDCAVCAKQGNENWFVFGPASTHHGGFANRADANLIAAAPCMAAYIQKRADTGDVEAIQLWERINGRA